MVKRRKILKDILTITMILLCIIGNNCSIYAKIIEGSNDPSKKGEYVGIAEKGGSYYAVYYDDNGDMHVVTLSGAKNADGTKTWYNPDFDDLSEAAYLSDSNKRWKEDQNKLSTDPSSVINSSASDAIKNEEGLKDSTVVVAQQYGPDNPDLTIGAGGADSILDGVAGVLLLPAKLMLVFLGEAIKGILGFFAGQGKDGVTLQQILFNTDDNLPIVDIDFFNFNSSDDSVNTIRQNVAAWYYGIRNLAAVLLVVVAIYVGIRMAISTVAEDKAKYKQMLIDWVTSLCLLFVLHYIMILVIQLNNTLVSTIGKAIKDEGDLNNVAETFKEIALQGASLNPLEWVNNSFSQGMSTALIYLILELMTLIYLLTYIKRMITIGFLIIIAPLVTVTYSIDKMGDGKSQALNQWFKEFAYNILIQPFQCVTYLALCSTSIKLVQDETNLKSAVLAISMIIFLITAEKIVKHIFHFRADSMAETVASAAVVGTALNSFTKAGSSMLSKAGGGDSDNKFKIPKQDDPQPAALPTSQGNQGNPDIEAGGGTGAGSNGPGQLDSGNTGSLGGGDAGGQPALDSGDTNSSNQRGSNSSARGRSSRAGATARKVGMGAANFVIGTNLRALGLLTGVAIGGATGDLKAAVTTGTHFYGLGSAGSRAITGGIKASHYKKETARAFEDYKAAREAELGHEIDDRQIKREGLAMLSGEMDANDDASRAYRDALLDMRNHYGSTGDDEEESLKHTSKVLDGIIDGEITEQSAPVRFSVSCSSF